MWNRAALLLALFAAPAALAQSQADPIKSFASLQLSPNGERLVSLDVLRTNEFDGATAHRVLVVRKSADGSIERTLDPCSACRYADPAWSPAGDAVAFLGFDRKQGKTQLFVAEGDDVRVVTVINGVAGKPLWSPDGRTIAVLATIDARKEAGAVNAGAPMIGEIGATEDEQRIATVAASGGALRLLSPDDHYIYEYDWTPDGKGFVATSAKGNGDNNWWIARLYAIDGKSGKMREIAAPRTQIANPHVSPDGRTVAFIGGLMSDFDVFSGDVFTVPFAGGTPTNVTPDYHGSFTSLRWHGDKLLANAELLDRAAIASVTPATKQVDILWQQPVTITPITQAGDVFAFNQQDFVHAQALFAGPIDRLQQITHDNDARDAAVKVRSVTWNNDGLTVQGWLLEPTTPAAAKRPLLVYAHGGPAAANMPFHVAAGFIRATLDAGYALFMPNPRGSSGQGETFKRGNVRDFGGGDLRDVLTGVDKVISVAAIDGERLGIFGGSYGGCMVMWAVTQSHRFKAAVASAGVANWVSYYGQNGINQWMIPFFGASAYDDPEIYRAVSPISRIKNAKTPTLIMVGERDVEVPPAQSLEFYSGLQAMQVESKLVIYEGEGHGIRRPDHVADFRKRTIDWLNAHLAPAGKS